MYINTFQYKPEHVDCRLCTEYAGKKKGCTAQGCPWLAERIEAGVVGYEEAVMETFPRNAHLDARLHTAIRRFTGSLFLSPAHQGRMERLKARESFRRKRDTPAYFAAMYLLTANDDLFLRSANCFCRHGIEFDYGTLKDISPPLLHSVFGGAGHLRGGSGVALADLANSEVVDTLAFSLIVNALLVARYGPAVLEIKERSRK